jgi:hypothetical protein
MRGEMAQLKHLGQIGALGAARDELPGRQPTPCTGALCSGNPAPVSKIPSVAPRIGGDWAINAFPIELAASGSFHFAPVNQHMRTTDPSCSIFHPPR